MSRVGALIGVAAIALGCCVAGVAPAGAAATWTITPAPNGKTSTDQLAAVSCSGATCVAVGQSTGPVGANGGIVEIKTGASWTLGAGPVPAGTENAKLFGVSCASATHCEAVGSAIKKTTFEAVAIAESWNGTTWTAQTLAVPAGATSSELLAVSCPATVTTCVAVGDYIDGSGNQHPLAQGFNGTSWSNETAPTPAGGDGPSLLGVACTVATVAPTFACTAVGTFDDSSFNGKNLAERWNGTTWTVQTVPSSGSESALAAVSCPSTTECVAVGNTSATAAGTLAMKWNGTTWAVLTTPGPPDGGAFDAVVCTSVTSCNAVGNGEFGIAPGPFAAVWNGTTWTAQTPPNKPTFTSEPDIDLAGVACTSPTACTAVGTFNDVVGMQHVLGEGLSGTTWTFLAIPDDLTPGSTAMHAVTCLSATDCLAVGNVAFNGGSGEPAVEQWNGTAWSITQLAALDDLAGISCSSPTTCLAVGIEADGRSSTGVAAESFHGGTWTALTPIQASALGGSFTGVSCPSATDCVAIGENEVWNGSTWTVMPAEPDDLTGISCTSTTNCIAVGTVDADSSFTAGAQLWNGTKWTTLSVPKPSGSTRSDLDAVTCTSSTACVAVGSNGTTASGGSTLVEKWNGTTWSIQTSANPAATNMFYSLSGVACTSVSACTAVGTAENSLADTTPLAETWNGTAWSLQPTTVPSGSMTSDFDGVACISATSCRAVGSSTNSAGLTVPLVEGPAAGATAPGAPTIGVASPGAGAATVRWTAPTNNGGSAVTGYVVTPFIGATAQTAHTFTTTATSESITGLTNGTTYTFKVAAKNAIGTGAQSASSNAVVAGAPVAPAAPHAVAGAKKATVSWTAPANNGSAITGYTLTPFKGGVAQTPIQLTSPATSHVVTGLTTGASYTFKVAAKNARGTGLPSAASNSIKPT